LVSNDASQLLNDLNVDFWLVVDSQLYSVFMYLDADFFIAQFVPKVVS